MLLLLWSTAAWSLVEEGRVHVRCWSRRTVHHGIGVGVAHLLLWRRTSDWPSLLHVDRSLGMALHRSALLELSSAVHGRSIPVRTHATRSAHVGATAHVALHSALELLKGKMGKIRNISSPQIKSIVVVQLCNQNATINI